MTNEQMVPNRFLKFYNARRRVAFINEHLTAGHIVQLTTYTKATRYSIKHLGWFKATKSGAYVRSGKNWLCIDGCKINAF